MELRTRLERRSRRAASLLLAAGLAAVAPLALSQTLTTVPMQGGMVMPSISYSASAGALHATVDPTVPQLTPLLASNPGAGFDPADPWCDCLDPIRQGSSFSRCYGFVMDANTDPLPAGTAIWIRKLSSTPLLGFYRYRSSAPKAWEPIFGTGGATNAMLWNGTMFHPGVAAPPGTNGHTALFEAFLVDTASGDEVPGAGTGPFLLRWSNASDGRPALRIAAGDSPCVAIAWPGSTSTNWVLVAAADPAATNWAVVTNAAALAGGECTVTLSRDAPQMFYRMRFRP
jgi:hypothetical protein